jgi:carboxyl-terminal processing protease
MEQAKPKISEDKKRSRLVLIVYLLGGFVIGVVSVILINNFILRRPIGSGIDTSLLSQVQAILNQKYDGEIDIKKQAEGAAAGAVAALGDPYTIYLDTKANKELSDDLKGELSGVGIEVGEKNGKLTVIAPIDGTPADKAGIKSGDFIAAIDGVDSKSLTIDEAVNRIRGEKGTEVKLTIIRGSEAPKEFKITREVINVPSVSYEMKDGSIGYIKIRRFGEDTAQLVKDAGLSLRSQGAKVLVLDLRDNPGGYLESSVDVASEFMTSGMVVEERSKKMKTKVHNVKPGGTLTDIPLVVLINGGSASASEILAGALSDNGRAVLIGEKSYGKGSVQEVICLNGSSLFSSNCNGPSLKVTVAHWYTPKGVNISKEGIMPALEVKLTDDDSNNNRDPQLQRAIEEAKKQIK